MSRPNDFIEISGTKMRKLAAQGAKPCDVSNGKEIPSDLLAANCVPPGFMVQSGWEIVCDYYQNVDTKQWIHHSTQLLSDSTSYIFGAIHNKHTKHTGELGQLDFKVFMVNHAGKTISPWHDVPLYTSADKEETSIYYHMVVEIPKYSTAKLEVNKALPNNPIMQDINKKDRSPRYYTYGVPIFNYGLLPQTWEDINHIDSETGSKGDGDPIDVIEVGDTPLLIGQVVSVKVLGSFALIDEGETDHKIIALRTTDKNIHHINTVYDLERYYPHVISNIVHWLKYYKTTDGKPANKLKSDKPTTPEQAVQIIQQVHGFYQNLVTGEESYGYWLPNNNGRVQSQTSGNKPAPVVQTKENYNAKSDEEENNSNSKNSEVKGSWEQ